MLSATNIRSEDDDRAAHVRHIQVDAAEEAVRVHVPADVKGELVSFLPGECLSLFPPSIPFGCACGAASAFEYTTIFTAAEKPCLSCLRPGYIHDWDCAFGDHVVHWRRNGAHRRRRAQLRHAWLVEQTSGSRRSRW